MSEQERLDLVTSVEPEFEEELDNLESGLNDVDDAIKDTGRGQDYVGINVIVDSGGALAELQALDSAIENLDDTVTIDIEANTSDVLREGVEPAVNSNPGQSRDANINQFLSASDALDERFGEIAKGFEETFDDVGTVDIQANLVDLDASVEPEFEEELDNLESGLNDVDDAIKDTGRGQDYVGINVIVDSGGALAELQALDSAIENLDDTVTIDIEADTSDVLREGVEPAVNSNPGQFRDANINQFLSASDALDERFGEIAKGFEETFDDVGTVDIQANLVDLDASATTDTPAPDTNSNNGGGLVEMDADDIIEAATSGGRKRFKNDPEDIPDNIPQHVFDVDDFETPPVGPKGIRGNFGQDFEAMADNQRSLMSFLTGGDPNIEVGTIDTDDVLTSRRNTGLAAEGIDSSASLDLATARMEAVRAQRRDDRDPTRRLRDAMGEIKKGIAQANFTMRSFHEIIASLIPIVAVFAGALPAAITGVAALGTAALGAAGALGAIGALGFGAMALQSDGSLSMKPIQQRFKEIKQTFVEALTPLMKEMAPLVKGLLSDLESMARPLANALGGLRQFKDEFRALGNFLANAIPSLVSSLLSFADAAMPIIKGVLGTLANQNILGFLANQLAVALPMLSVAGNVLLEALPAIVRVSQGFLTLASTILFLLKPLFVIINGFPLLGKVIGFVIAAFIGLIATTTLFLKVSAIMTATAIPGAIVSLGEFALAFIGVGNAATWAAAAVGTLISLVTLGLGAIAVSGIASSFFSLGNGVRDATDALKQFSNTSVGDKRLGTNIQSPSGSSGVGVYQDNSTTVINAQNSDQAAREQYNSQYERRKRVDSVFGGGP